MIRAHIHWERDLWSYNNIHIQKRPKEHDSCHTNSQIQSCLCHARHHLIFAFFRTASDAFNTVCVTMLRISVQLRNSLGLSFIAVAKEGGGAWSPGPVEPDKSSLWIDLFSLDSVILIVVTCNCLLFSYLRSIFRRHLMTSAENSVSEPPNLKIFWEKDPTPPPPPYEARARLRHWQ